MTIVIGVGASYLGLVGLTVLNSFWPAEEVGERLAGQDAFRVLGMERLHDDNGRAGYIVPPGTDPRPLQRAMSYTQKFRERVVDPRVEQSWTAENNAIDVGATAWQITLEGNRTSPVVITDIRPIEIECGPPLTGGFVDLGGQGEGDKPHLVATIDGARQVFDRVNAEEDDVPHYFSTKTIDLQRQEKMVLVLIGRTNEKHCTWKYRVNYMDGSVGGAEQVISAPGGKPFESTGVADRRHELYAWVIPGASEQTCAEGDVPPVVNGEQYRAYSRGEIKCL